MSEQMSNIRIFHNHYGWKDQFETRTAIWEAAFGDSHVEAMKKAFMDWLGAQKGKNLEAPMPGDIRPYYTSRMEQVRRFEREQDEKPKGLYRKMSAMEFDPSKCEPEKIRHCARLIRTQRANRPKTGAYDSQGRQNGHDKSWMGMVADRILQADEALNLA